MNFGSTAGRWTAIIPPLTSRRREFRLLASNADVPGISAQVVAGEYRPRKEYEVTLTLNESPNTGDWSFPPLLTGQYGEQDDIDDFLRAIVNEAARHGIYADNAGDVAKELGAAREHLEDMRRLALGAKFEARKK